MSRLHLRTRSGKVVLERPEGVASCRSFRLTSFTAGEQHLALPHKNLSLSAASISFPPILSWSLLQDCIFAHQLWSRRGTWPTLQRKKKMFHEASRDEQSVASTHRSLAAYFQRREAWESR